jgi:hypothetical protein
MTWPKDAVEKSRIPLYCSETALAEIYPRCVFLRPLRALIIDENRVAILWMLMYWLECLLALLPTQWPLLLLQRIYCYIEAVSYSIR